MKTDKKDSLALIIICSSLFTIILLLSFLPAFDLKCALLISWLYRLSLLLQILLCFLGSFFAAVKKMRKEIFLVTILFSMFSLYVAKLFSKGVFFALSDEDTAIIPSMRSSAAYIMLKMDGKLDFQLDPHYLYPLEYLATYVCTIITGLTYQSSYVLCLGTFSLLLNSIIIYLLLCKVGVEVAGEVETLLRLLALTFLFNLLSTFYLSEFALARGIFYLLITYAILNLRSSELEISKLYIVLLLLTVGALMGSLRVTSIMALLFTLITVFYLIKKPKVRGIFEFFTTIAAISVVSLLYYGEHYTESYTDYIMVLTSSIWSVIEDGSLEIRRPPLHTVIEKQYHNSYTIMSFLGGLSLIALLVMSYALILINLVLRCLYRDKSFSHTMDKSFSESLGLTSYEVIFCVTSLLSGSLIGIAYLLNVLGRFTIDFESLTDLLLPFPLAMILIMRSLGIRRSRRLLFKKSITGLLKILMILIIITSAFSVFGLGLRHPTLCMADTALVPPNNALNGIRHANNMFIFLLTYSNSSPTFVLSTTFSKLYLTLPLKYLRANVMEMTLNQDIFMSNLVYNSLIYTIAYTNDNRILVLDNIELLPL